MPLQMFQVRIDTKGLVAQGASVLPPASPPCCGHLDGTTQACYDECTQQCACPPRKAGCALVVSQKFVIAGATVVVDNPTYRSELAPTEPHRSVCQDQLLAMILTVASTAPSASQFSNVCQPATSPTMASNCLQRLSAPTCPSTASLLTVFTRGCEPPITVPTWDQISLRSGPRCRWVILAHGHEA